MPKLTEIVSSRKTISVPFGETALRVTYRPSAVTPRLQKAVAQAQRDQDLDAGLLDPIAALLVSWDLTDDADERIEITPATLTDVPAAVLLGIMSAIGEDMAPNPTRGAASHSGSSQTAGSAASPIGTQR